MKRITALIFIILCCMFILVGCAQNAEPVHTHTVQIGTCPECGEFQNRDLVDSVTSKLESAKQSFDIAISYINSVSSYSSYDSQERVYNAILESENYFEDSQAELQSALLECGDYEELSSAKQAIQTTINKMPKSPTSSDLNCLYDFLDEASAFAVSLADAQLKILKIT